MTEQTARPDLLGERLAEIPPLVDVDAHVVEPPDVWSSRLPARLREAGPRVEYAPRGSVRLVDGKYVETPATEGPDAAWWVYGDSRAQIKRYVACPGMSADEVTNEGITYEDMRPGCHVPAERLADMDLNGVEAQMCFPNYPRFCGQIFLWAQDKDLARRCVEAYNDWMVEEWCGGSGGRLIPLCIVPLWDVELAAAEVRRNAARGVRAVAFTELPAYLDLPSLHTGYWDPFFRACEETGTVLSMHIGSGTKTPQSAPDAPPAVGATIIFGNSVASMTDFMLSGVLHRFPGLKLLYAEAQIGWIPYLLERVDDVWQTHRGWADTRHNCPEPPSTYYYRQITGCFFKDAIGVEMLEKVGVDNATFETDYPHQDGTWPRSREEAAIQFGHLDRESVHKIARNNAIRLLGLDLPVT